MTNKIQDLFKIVQTMIVMTFRDDVTCMSAGALSEWICKGLRVP